MVLVQQSKENTSTASANERAIRQRRTPAQGGGKGKTTKALALSRQGQCDNGNVGKARTI